MLKWGSYLLRERKKGVLRAAHPRTRTPFQGEYPPPGFQALFKLNLSICQSVQYQ